jgi:hypothetical protein
VGLPNGHAAQMIKATTNTGLPTGWGSAEMDTIFGDSAPEILTGLWIGDAESAPMAIARDFAVLNVLEAGAIPGENTSPFWCRRVIDRPADGVFAYRVRLDNAVKRTEENKSIGLRGGKARTLSRPSGRGCLFRHMSYADFAKP